MKSVVVSTFRLTNGIALAISISRGRRNHGHRRRRLMKCEEEREETCSRRSLRAFDNDMATVPYFLHHSTCTTGECCGRVNGND
jgi:hypothetical protein